ncbi:RNA polymerase sigma factor [Evansella sp. AB-P1]|uniref:RNA polymerase sigma factor n=1 Tax=Evansella sp. AB-P1 TaxID=3037653 RepID=UPI00241E70B9|nr:RNA polymerase sigma factor [Evansella sp. AB-P1]MDG5788021.1 RNA polymerase sigma factor [Evansella sp. AB-P1]
MNVDKSTQVSDWYVEHGLVINNYINRMICDYHEAEDLTQETFIRAYRFFDSYNNAANAKTWLFRIAHNVTVDYIRKKKPLTMMDDNVEDERDDKNLLPQEIVERKEESSQLYTCINNLKPSYRDVIVERKLNECTIKETCDKLHWSEGKVKSTLHRAIPVLMERMKKDEFTDWQKTV